MTGAPEQNGRPDGGLLPSLLDGLARRLSIEALDELWIFPTRRIGTSDSTVVVISAFDGGGDRRRVLTAHFLARRGPRGKVALEENVTEHGTAPAARIERLVEGVLRRLDQELAALPPRAARIAGEPARWTRLLEELAAPDDDGSAPPAG